MVEINYSADVDHIDEPVIEAEAEQPGKPIRIRIQPSIFRKVEGQQGQHKSWQGVSWVLECANAKETIQVREALRAFFEAVGREGPRKVKIKLEEEVSA